MFAQRRVPDFLRPHWLLCQDSDPAQRIELEEFQRTTLIQIERARKRGLKLEVIRYQKKLKQCEAEIKEKEEAFFSFPIVAFSAKLYGEKMLIRAIW